MKQIQAMPIPFTIDFEDVTKDPGPVAIPDSYRGLNWTDFTVRTGRGEEFVLGIVSGMYAALNVDGKACSIRSSMPLRKFSVSGFQATAIGKKGLDLLVEGLDDKGKVVGSYETTLGDPHDGPVSIKLHEKYVEGSFEGLHEFRLETRAKEGSSQVMVDNLKVAI